MTDARTNLINPKLNLIKTAFDLSYYFFAAPPQDLAKCMKTALDIYKSFWLTWKGRVVNVEKYIEEMTKLAVDNRQAISDLISKIFSEGGWNNRSYNPILLGIYVKELHKYDSKIELTADELVELGKLVKIALLFHMEYKNTIDRINEELRQKNLEIEIENKKLFDLEQKNVDKKVIDEQSQFAQQTKKVTELKKAVDELTRSQIVLQQDTDTRFVAHLQKMQADRKKELESIKANSSVRDVGELTRLLSKAPKKKDEQKSGSSEYVTLNPSAYLALRDREAREKELAAMRASSKKKDIGKLLNHFAQRQPLSSKSICIKQTEDQKLWEQQEKQRALEEEKEKIAKLREARTLELSSMSAQGQTPEAKEARQNQILQLSSKLNFFGAQSVTTTAIYKKGFNAKIFPNKPVEVIENYTRKQQEVASEAETDVMPKTISPSQGH